MILALLHQQKKAPNRELFLVHDSEVVDDTQQSVVLVHHQQGVNLVLMEHVLNLCQFGFWIDGLWSRGHRFRYREVEEILLRTLYRTTDVTIGHGRRLHHGQQLNSHLPLL